MVIMGKNTQKKGAQLNRIKYKLSLKKGELNKRKPTYNKTEDKVKSQV